MGDARTRIAKALMPIMIAGNCCKYKAGYESMQTAKMGYSVADKGAAAKDGTISVDGVWKMICHKRALSTRCK
jgi:hypothetical protein